MNVAITAALADDRRRALLAEAQCSRELRAARRAAATPVVRSRPQLAEPTRRAPRTRRVAIWPLRRYQSWLASGRL
jgi:hypothetical protein